VNGIEIEGMAQAIGILDASIGGEVAITYERGGEQQAVALQVPDASLPVTAVAPGSPAQNAGLYATDEITSIDGEPVTSGQAFISSLMNHAGETVEIGYVRTTESGPVDSTTSLTIPPVDALERSQVLPHVGL